MLRLKARLLAALFWLAFAVSLGLAADRPPPNVVMVVFVVDNGWIQNVAPGRSGFAPKSKRSPYDGGVRTPILLRWPDHTVAGRYDDLVSTIDLAPTILAACGVEPPDTMPGLSLLEVAAGRGPLPRTFVRGEIYVHTCVDLERTPLNLTHRWVRQGDWKLIEPLDARQPRELYNLRNDPAETKNLLDEYRDEATRLATLLEN